MINGKRKRRIASDEAHSWARNLRLGNPYAKLVLSMIALYVNGDGVCFVSIAQLAEDCEFAAETVRRRLLWLEKIGALVRMPQWRDESGRLNSEGRGKRTTDEIRLLFDVDQEIIEANASGSGDGEEYSISGASEISPPPERVANDGNPATASPPLSHPVATQQPPNCGGGLITEPEPEPEEEKKESPPTPPSGGDEEFSKTGIGAERLRLIEPIWPDAITDAHRAINVLAALNQTEWQQCFIGAKGYAAFIRNRRKAGRPRIVKDFHNWARNAQWRGFATLGEQAEANAQRKVVPFDSPEGKAWAVLCRIAHIPRPEFRGDYVIPHELSPQILALAEAPERWCFIAEGQSSQVGAWRGLIGRELRDRARPELINDRDWRGHRKIRERGFLAPWLWPPKVDGSIYAHNGPDPPALSPDGVNEEAAKEFSELAR
jgi:hypothetical protein